MAPSRRSFLRAGVALAASLFWPGGASGCPFCGSVGEPLARKRDAATVVAIAEADGPARRDAAGLLEEPFRLLQALPAGRIVAADPPERVVARVAAPVIGTAVVFGSADDPRRYGAVSADEAVLGHVVQAPGADRPAPQRLAWYAARLEHPSGVIAEDAFAEFGLASFADVSAVAAALAERPLVEWIADPAIDQRRRGFYGLALGIVAAAGLPAGKPATSAPLRAALATAGGDFRGGADGLMGGILVADGVEGLAWLLERAGPDRPVDQRQLLGGLRFAHESLADSIPKAAVERATARLAESASVAADAIVDLARYRVWDELDMVSAWWDRAADDPLLRRAVVGYLLACPLPEAAVRLEHLERDAPEAFARAKAAALSPLAGQ